MTGGWGLRGGLNIYPRFFPSFPDTRGNECRCEIERRPLFCSRTEKHLEFSLTYLSDFYRLVFAIEKIFSFFFFLIIERGIVARDKKSTT